MALTTPERIRSYADLKKGWHYGEGDAIDAETIRRALLVYAMIETRGFRATNSFPGVDGDLMVTAYAEGYYLGIIVKPEELYDYEYEHEQEMLVDLCDIQLEEVFIELGQIGFDLPKE